MFNFDKRDFRSQIILKEFVWYQKRLKNSNFGISDVWQKSRRRMNKKTLEMIEFFSENYYRAIELEDLTFAFLVLGIGLFSSIVCFIIEYTIEVSRLKKIKIRTRWLKVKQYTVLTVRSVILKFSRLWDWLNSLTVKKISNCWFTQVYCNIPKFGFVILVQYTTLNSLRV